MECIEQSCLALEEHLQSRVEISPRVVRNSREKLKLFRERDLEIFSEGFQNGEGKKKGGFMVVGP